MGSLIGQPLQDSKLKKVTAYSDSPRISALVFYDPETNEVCRYVAEVDRYEEPYIRLIRTSRENK